MSTERLNFCFKIIAHLRADLDLPLVIRGSPDLLGLYTLLEGAQLDYRKMTFSILAYLHHKATGNESDQRQFELEYPDRFHHNLLKDVTMPEFAKPWTDIELAREDIPLSRVKHSLINLGLKSDINHIVDVITALFTILDSDDLLKNFETIAGFTSTGTESSQAVKATGKRFSREVRALMDRVWFEVIGSNNVDRLRYYLRNLLALHVIPGIIGQVLESAKNGDDVDLAKYDDALKLAELIHKIPGVTQVIKSYPKNAPNYYEFIMIYATE
ncbi:hypothetical protein H4R35_002521, partial [Dimargaris xerosporica]